MDERDERSRPEERPPKTSAGSTGQAGQSSVDTPGFSRTGLKERRQGPTDPSRDWPGADEKQEGTDGE
jgi:hypothetical protein